MASASSEIRRDGKDGLCLRSFRLHVLGQSILESLMINLNIPGGPKLDTCHKPQSNDRIQRFAFRATFRPTEPLLALPSDPKAPRLGAVEIVGELKQVECFDRKARPGKSSHKLQCDLIADV